MNYLHTFTYLHFNLHEGVTFIPSPPISIDRGEGNDGNLRVVVLKLLFEWFDGTPSAGPILTTITTGYPYVCKCDLCLERWSTI